MTSFTRENNQQDMSSMIKAQMMAMGMANGGGGGGGNQTMYTMIIGMLIMSFVDLLSKQLPLLIRTTKELVNKYLESKARKLHETIMTPGDGIKLKSEITFEKIFNCGKNTDETAEAILDICCKKDKALRLAFRDGFFVSNMEPFLIMEKPEVHFKLLNIKRDSKENLDAIVFKIYSYSIELSELRDIITDISDTYSNEKKNELGQAKYFFDEIPISIPKDIDGNLRFDQAPYNLMFTMTKFSTTKSLSNLYGNHIKKIQKRVKHFITKPEWYYNNGVPYTLGMLLYGKPGCGKTSIIKAIAKDTKRHIINIKLRETTTQTQLKNLFFNDILTVTQNGTTKTYYIPTSERIYVMEDIDCLSSVVLSREQNLPETSSDFSLIETETETKTNGVPSDETNTELKLLRQEFLKLKGEMTDVGGKFISITNEKFKDKFMSFLLNNEFTRFFYLDSKIGNNKIKYNLLPESEQDRFVSCYISSKCYDEYRVFYKDKNPFKKEESYLLDKLSKIDGLTGLKHQDEFKKNTGIGGFDHMETTFEEKKVGANNVPGLDSQFESTSLLPPGFKSKTNSYDDDKINLSFILNLFDGILETPGRIFIMTTNYPDRIDSALTRPGRVDLRVEFTSCDNAMIHEMFKAFYSITDMTRYKELENANKYNLRPCELQGILNDNYDDPDACLQDILNF